MNTHDDDLRVRLGRICNRGSRYKGFFAEVRSAARNEGYISARSRSPRLSRPSLSYFGAAAAPPCGFDQALDRTPKPARRLMPGFSIRPDASLSKHASCVTAGSSRQLSQRTFAISSAMA
jgi:hypothetical protein